MDTSFFIRFYHVDHQAVHFHYHELELLLLLRGTLEVTAGKRKVVLNEGGFLTIDSGQMHALEALAPNTCIATIHICLDAFIDEFPYIRSTSFSCCLADGDHELNKHLLRNLYCRMLLLNNKNTERARTNMDRLLRRVLYVHNNCFQNPDFLSEFVKPMENEHMDRLRRIGIYIARHFKSNLTLADIARDVNISETRISHFFKEMTGISIREAIKLYRLTEAERLLYASSKPIAEIITLSGFSDPKHFYRRFYERNGMAPGEYRRLIRQQLEAGESVDQIPAAEATELVFDYVLKYYSDAAGKETWSYPDGESAFERHTHTILTTILCHSDELARCFDDNRQRMGYIVISSGRYILKEQGEYHVIWEAVYAAVHLYRSFNFPMRILVDFEALQSTIWENILDSLLCEIGAIWGEDCARSLELCLLVHHISAREDSRALVEKLREHPLSGKVSAILIL